MGAPQTLTVGEALVSLLEQAGVDTVFGIPGVHTIELYRGLAASRIRHVTPRHEQGAAFMADGHARVTGRPGVCLLITGPGLTNAATAMAQARAEGVPMLVITGVNARATLGKGRGHLHELPDQGAFAKSVALASFRLDDPDDLSALFSKAFALTQAGRPGPVHLEIPTDVMAAHVGPPVFSPPAFRREPEPFRAPLAAEAAQAARRLREAERVVIVAGGGARRHAAALRALAETLDAPVISTVNARGVMAGSPLDVPASPSLEAARALLADADCVLALGTEFGPTDFDMYETGTMPVCPGLIRVDIDRAQLARRDADIRVEADAGAFIAALMPHLSAGMRDGAMRAAAARAAAWAELSPRYRALTGFVHDIWRGLPDAVIAGDSTQPVYAGNLYAEAPAAGRWFNSATGFGTLGHAIPAAIGAALAGASPVVALTGDGGAQFTLAELGSARDAKADVLFVIWHNDGYQEIEAAMVAAGVTPEGVRPSAPDFAKSAEASGLPVAVLEPGGDVAGLARGLPRPGVLIVPERAVASASPDVG
jgi:acetolactate synthase-1/2/3 large subunit